MEKKDILLDWKEGRKEGKEREFPSKRATVVFGSLERGSHDDFLSLHRLQTLIQIS
jgi:predicted nucleotidyltransferase